MKRTEHTQNWLDALRSGRYSQTTRTLKDDECGYCCLGVAAEVAGIAFGMSGVYPAIREAMGLDIDEQRGLAEMNDVDGKTFPEIAAAIEAMIE